jgi:ketosteroid isomerase-like protein
MTTTDLAIVEDLYNAFAERDLETVQAALAPDVLIEQDAPLPWAGRYTGPHGFMEFFGILLAHIDPAIEVGELIATGSHIAQIGHSNGRVRHNGNTYRAREVHIWQLHEGKVTSFQVYVDVPRVLTALASPAAESS